MSDAEKLSADILALSPSDQLRLAAELLDKAAEAKSKDRRPFLKLAHTLADRVSTETGALLMVIK